MCFFRANVWVTKTKKKKKVNCIHKCAHVQEAQLSGMLILDLVLGGIHTHMHMCISWLRWTVDPESPILSGKARTKNHHSTIEVSDCLIWKTAAIDKHTVYGTQ